MFAKQRNTYTSDETDSVAQQFLKAFASVATATHAYEYALNFFNPEGKKERQCLFMKSDRNLKLEAADFLWKNIENGQKKEEHSEAINIFN